MVPAVVIAVYLIVLVLILLPPRKLAFAFPKVSWWRDVRFWAAFVIVAQVAVYAVWG